MIRGTHLAEGIQERSKDEERKAQRISPNVRPRCKWRDSVKVILKETDDESVEWICLVQGRGQ